MDSSDLLPNLLAQNLHWRLLLKIYMAYIRQKDYPRGIIRPA
jgi:hypothetical protein